MRSRRRHPLSELCAQWKAADASEQSARYALWALIVSAIGTVLLVWTLAETRATSRRELRAYVSVKVRAVQAGIIEGRGLNVTFDTVSHNGGQTPAYDCVHFGTIAICRPEDAKSNLSAVKPIDANEIHGGAVIHSGEDFPVEKHHAILHTARDDPSDRDGRAEPICFWCRVVPGHVRYPAPNRLLLLYRGRCFRQRRENDRRRTCAHQMECDSLP